MHLWGQEGASGQRHPKESPGCGVPFRNVQRVFLLLGPITCFPRQGSVPLEQGDSTGTRLCCPHTKGEGSQPSLSPSRALASPLTSLPVGSKCLCPVSAL